MFKRLLFLFCLAIIIIAMLNAKIIGSIVADFLHFSKNNESFISKSYDMIVEKEERGSKNLTFFGVENNTNRPIIVVVAYNRGTFAIYEDEGITREEAISIAEKEDVKILSSFLVTWHTFSEEKDIKDYLYWCIDTKNQDNRLYIRFLDGEIVDKN
ncbi:MAG: hypothetical protein ACLKAK_06165 [Alkaliphilus sp.]